MAFREMALRRLQISIMAHEDEINRALRLDLGKSASEAYMCETGMVLDELRYIAKHLEKWAKQGVLLLNTVLTVRAHQANSHRGIGWEQFTDAAIRILDQEDRPIVFLLWGRPAQMKASMLHNPKHLILEAPHPSPLSAYRGFFGCKHFSKANEFLKANGVEPVDWQIENI